jgi:hypothetical protein
MPTRESRKTEPQPEGDHTHASYRTRLGRTDNQAERISEPR